MPFAYKESLQDRDQANTRPDVNRRIAEEIDQSVERLPAYKIPTRLAELDREWSVDRVLEAHSSAAGLAGIAVTALIESRFLFMPLGVASMVWIHAVKGWYPLLPLFRYLGVRTRGEMDRERYGLLRRVGQDPPLEQGRVRSSTAATVQDKIDRDTEERIRRTLAAGQTAVFRRLLELDSEWDIERLLQLNASSLAGIGLLLSLRDRRWLALPAAVFSFFLQHAVQGWCPPIPVLRRLGVRTRAEIDREKYALEGSLS